MSAETIKPTDATPTQNPGDDKARRRTIDFISAFVITAVVIGYLVAFGVLPDSYTTYFIAGPVLLVLVLIIRHSLLVAGILFLSVAVILAFNFGDTYDTFHGFFG